MVNKQLSDPWFGTSWRPCNVTIMNIILCTGPNCYPNQQPHCDYMYMCWMQQHEDSSDNTSNYRKTLTIFRVKGNTTWTEIRMFHHIYFIKIDSPNIYYKITDTTSYHKSPLWQCLYALRNWFSSHNSHSVTVYPKKYAHGFSFAVLCCGYTLTDFPISIRLTSLALWQSNDCPSASKATLMNMDKYFMWIHYERLHNHNKAKHNKTVCIFLGIYCMPTNELAMQKIDTL